jgi:hypothetical protein
LLCDADALGEFFRTHLAPVTAMVKHTRDVDLRSFEAARDIAAMLPECR